MSNNKVYKIKLTEIQINNIYRITDNKDKQSKIMSILSYLMKYTDAASMKLLKSLNRLFNMYSAKDWKYHSKIARSYFYEIANLILDNKYFFSLGEDKKVETLADKINSTKTIEITNVESDFKNPNNIITKNNTNTYTLDTDKSVNASDLAEYVFKDLKIKSKVIKEMVLSKLCNVVLDTKGALNYIIKVITEKTEQYNNIKVNYALKVAETKYYKSKSRCNVADPIPSPTKFNNFEPRQYDYDSLEKKLLGWDNDLD